MPKKPAPGSSTARHQTLQERRLGSLLAATRLASPQGAAGPAAEDAVGADPLPALEAAEQKLTELVIKTEAKRTEAMMAGDAASANDLAELAEHFRVQRSTIRRLIADGIDASPQMQDALAQMRQIAGMIGHAIREVEQIREFIRVATIIAQAIDQAIKAVA